MTQQHLLDLARVDVRPARDDELLAAVDERQVAVPVDPTQVSRVQPAARERPGGGLRIVQVPRHHDLPAHRDLADLARPERPVVGVEHRELDTRLRPTDRRQPSEQLLVARTGVLRRGQHRDRHRRLSLAVDLGQARPEPVERAQAVRDVHRPAAVDHGLQPRRVATQAVDQPHHHRRRGEELDRGDSLEELVDLGDVEATRGGDQLRAARDDVREDVEARSVRHRCRVQQVVAGDRRIDVGEVAQRHRPQVAVREHHALRPAGGAAGVEEPRDVGGRHVGRLHRVGVLDEGLVLARVDVDERRGAVRACRLGRRRVHVVGHEAHRGAGVVEHECDLPGVQLDVDRDDRGPGRPARVHELDVGGAVAHHERDPVARRDAEARPQSAGQGEGAAGERGVAPLDAVALDHRGSTRPPACAAQEVSGEVHVGVDHRPGAVASRRGGRPSRP